MEGLVVRASLEARGGGVFRMWAVKTSEPSRWGPRSCCARSTAGNEVASRALTRSFTLHSCFSVCSGSCRVVLLRNASCRLSRPTARHEREHQREAGSVDLRPPRAGPLTATSNDKRFLSARVCLLLGERLMARRLVSNGWHVAREDGAVRRHRSQGDVGMMMKRMLLQQVQHEGEGTGTSVHLVLQPGRVVCSTDRGESEPDVSLFSSGRARAEKTATHLSARRPDHDPWTLRGTPFQ